MQDSRSQSVRSANQIPAAAAVALIAGISLAAFDAAILILGKATPSMAALSTVLLHTAGSMVVIWAVYFLLWLLIGLPCRWIGKLPAYALSVALALAMVPPATMRQVFALFASPTATVNPYLLGMLLGLSVLTGAGGYFAARAVARQEEIRRKVLAAAWVLPVVTMEVLAVAWLRSFHVPRGLSWRSIALYLGFLILVVVTVALMRSARLRGRAWTVSMLIVFVLLAVLAAYPFTIGPRIETHVTPFARAHAIKRVILITIDTLRWDALTVYNPASELSPHLTALAGDSIVFQNAYAPSPWTLPSLASIMTGLSPLVHGVSKENPGFPHKAPMLADLLADAGYVTGAFGGNALLDRQEALARGFQAFHFPRGRPADTLGKLGLTALVGRAVMSGQTMTETITALAETWTRANKEHDFLLWVHYFDPHTPYVPPVEFISNRQLAPNLDMAYQWDFRGVRNGDLRLSLKQQAWVQELYRAEVRYVDDRIGRLIRTLKESDLYEESMIVVTNDHGEEFWDHGSVDHGHTLYDEMIRAPLLIKLPASSPPPARPRVDNYVSTVSLLPTILELCDIHFKPQEFSAPSLAPLWAETAQTRDDRPLFAGNLVYYLEQEAVIEAGWKYIQVLGQDQDQLYNMNIDPGRDDEPGGVSAGAESGDAHSA